MNADRATIAGPHRPARECAGCAGLLEEPPDGARTLADLGRLFQSVEHLPGYTALRPVPGWHFRTLPRDRQTEGGQGFAEYGLLLTLVAILCLVALVFMGHDVSGILSAVGSSV